MDAPSPRWRRRKTARPGEIEAAALNVFIERGFAAARLEEIAERAGLSKAALYLYYDSKAALFRAVVLDRAGPNLDQVEKAVRAAAPSLRIAAPIVLGRMAMALSDETLRGLFRVVLAEGGRFPEIARHWHDVAVSRGLGLLTELIQSAQARGEARAGDRD